MPNTTLPIHRLTPVPIRQVVIEDEFWSPRRRVWQEVTIPDCLAKFEREGALTNFVKIRDGAGGEHGGPPWYDGLLYEMIRGCADFMAAQPDPALEARLDSAIAQIAAAAAQDPDGYVNTYTQLKEPTHRWGLQGGNDNWQHDVYNAGCMVEAAVHYYRATGKTDLLKVATRLVKHMCDVMGPPPRQNVVPGHSVAEEALVKLYLLFQEKPALHAQMPVPVDQQRILQLVEFWIENRGNPVGRTSYGSYGQDHQPVLAQETLEGHAVRATLLCTGLVAAANVNGRADYYAAAQRLWDNMVQRRMYITGGLGAVAGHEGFGPDYELPNTGYLETCAAVGAGFFHHNMNLAFGEARSVDELERVLYNGILSGISLPGDTHFYENPLEGGTQRARWAWHGCPCCPPMFAKIMGALPGYVYAQDAQGLYVNLFVGSRAEATVGGLPVALTQTTRYPWDGRVQITLAPAQAAEFDLYVRIPGWCQGASSPDDLYTLLGRPSSGAVAWRVNGDVLRDPPLVRGYARLQRVWRAGDRVEIEMAMPVRRVTAHARVAADAGRVALMRGPLVYCIESVDTREPLRDLRLPPEAALVAEHHPDLLGGVTVIRGSAQSAAATASQPRDPEFMAIPYYANANRGPAEMRVWLPVAGEANNPAA